MIYLDSCILIYAVEDAGALTRRARDVLQTCPEPLAVSPLVASEVLVHPLRRNDGALLDAYEAFFESATMCPITPEVYVVAAQLRAGAPGLKTVDALHIATAQLSGCTALWTNDSRLSAVSGDYAVDVMHD